MYSSRSHIPLLRGYANRRAVHLVTTVCNIYEDATTTGTGQIGVGRGVVRDDPLSPIVFNVAMEPLLRRTLNDTSLGFKIGDSRISVLAYTDGLTIVCGSSASL